LEETIKEQVCNNSMAEEYESIMQTEVWDIIPRLKGKSIVTSKWLFKIKHGIDGSIDKYRARFIA